MAAHSHKRELLNGEQRAVQCWLFLATFWFSSRHELLRSIKPTADPTMPKQLAEQFIDALDLQGKEARTVGNRTALLWWDEKTPISEYELLDSVGKQSGYIVVTDDPQLPPVFEFTTSGPLLSESVTRRFEAYAESSEEAHKGVEILYFSPLDIALKVRYLRGDERLFLLPQMEPIEVPQPHTILRNQRSTYDSHRIERYRTRLSCHAQQAEVEEVLSIPKILGALAPVPYNQGCRELLAPGATGDPPAHYCDPECIAGCVPVGWAMFASSRKKSSRGGGSTKIWDGVGCWDTPWPSTIPPASQCTEVSNTIWDLHSRLDTTCDGGTFDDEIIRGGDYFNDTWNLGWQWAQQTNVDFSTCEALLEDDQTFVLSAVGEFGAYLTQHFPSLNNGLGEVGHCVVTFGKVISSYTSERFLLITLGWGDGFGNDPAYPGSKWVNFDTLSRTRIIYVRQF